MEQVLLGEAAVVREEARLGLEAHVQTEWETHVSVLALTGIVFALVAGQRCPTKWEHPATAQVVQNVGQRC